MPAWLESNFNMTNLLTLVIAGLAFYMALLVTRMFLEKQERDKRVDLITREREELRRQYRQEVEKQRAQGRLRDKPKGLLPQIVEALNLRKVFDAEEARRKLRMAGYRLERHLVTFLGVRLITPLVFAVLAYIYMPLVMGDDANPLLSVIIGFLIGYFLPVLWLSNTITKRQQSIREAWSDALDLLLICVESGQSLEQALNRVSLEISTQSRPLAEELQLATAELSYLGDRRQALENLARRTGLPTVKSVVTAMIQSERYGTPLAQALRALAKENREERMQEIEKKAAALPPKLTVPLILFFLPVIFVVLLVPAFIDAGYL